MENQTEPKQQETNRQDEQEKQPERAPNWITDMYDKMNVPVRTLDAALLILGALIALLLVSGNKIHLGI